MDLIEQYIQAVISYLPGSLKNKARKVVRNQIEEGLPADYTEMDIHNELQKLGSPQDYARVFRTSQYLIGPNYYPQYLTFLRIIWPVAYVIFLVSNVWDTFFHSVETYGFSFIDYLVIQPLNGTIQVVLGVTLIFIILEKKNIPLPESILIIPKQKDEGEEPPRKIVLIVNAFLTLGGLFLIQFFGPWIAIYPIDSAPIPLFVQYRLNDFLPFIFGLGALQLLFLFIQSIVHEWTVKLAAINALYNVAVFIFLIVFILDRQLFNPAFLAYFGEQLFLAISFLILSFGLCLIDSARGFKRALAKK